MNSTTDRTSVAARRDAMRPLRYALRAPFVLLHIVFALPLAVIALNPLLARIPVGRRRFDQFMISWWSGTLVRLFGFRIRAFGVPFPVRSVRGHRLWAHID